VKHSMWAEDSGRAFSATCGKQAQNGTAIISSRRVPQAQADITSSFCEMKTLSLWLTKS